MYVIVVYVPDEYVTHLIAVMASAGAGQIGNYRACAFSNIGTGQFEPVEGSNPFIGEVSNLEVVEERRIEMVCIEDNVRPVLVAMLKAHPYEVPAYHVLSVKTLDDFPAN